ncbi:unnamed protein product [Caenorhabditis bovis]|uniref:Serpentine receptor class gamma n=1 Tax=Caenorhabditis bovis TaxID=2654633 RepID=A0A8S1F2R3_9PELO|nr:unnamed protein product [Caenorhabditis bovis]
MSQYDWNNVAYQLTPLQPYMDFYSNQPRSYMFQGANDIDILMLLGAIPMVLIFFAVCFRSTPSLTKTFLLFPWCQIVLNMLIRLFKAGILRFIPYPDYPWLFVSTSIETTLYYTLDLQLTSSVLLYAYFRGASTMAPPSTRLLFAFLLLVAFAISAFNINFNALLYGFPFYVHVVFFVITSFSNLVILITLIVECVGRKPASHDIGVRLRLFIFILISSPPILFNTAVTVMDLLFMFIGVTEQFPIPYLIMVNCRYKAFEITPIAFLIAAMFLLPDLMKPVETTTTITTPNTERISHATSADRHSSPPARQIRETPADSVPGVVPQNSQFGSIIVHLNSSNNSQ